ncbi:hypothetical protein ABTF26_21075, partial [Acinetobacter baumannii]
SLGIAPFVFGAAGLGRIARPSAAEPAHLRVAALGAGARAQLDTSKNHEIWPACGIEDHAGALMPDFRPFLPA